LCVDFKKHALRELSSQVINVLFDLMIAKENKLLNELFCIMYKQVCIVRCERGIYG